MKLDRNFYVGKVLSGYTIEKFIGAGAFAYVYLASSPVGQKVAVKIQYNLVDDARIRFGREIKVLKEVPPSPYVVAYYADGNTAEGYPYLVMEFVNGVTLKDSLKKKPVWPVNESCDFMIQLCDAFDGLHQLGLAHRDVKPDNIMITQSNQVKLMDLGLVKDAQGLLKLLESEDILEGKDFAENLDKGVLAGTPEYMAPEQFSDPSLDDESQAKTDTWTDVYSLGLIFYEMLTGIKLFPFNPPNGSQGEYARALLAYLKQRTTQNDNELVEHPNIPYQLWTIIARSLHCDPTMRQRNASILAEDIRKYVTTGEGVVEQDSDKTSAIDLAKFNEMFLRGREETIKAAEPAPAAPQPAPAPVVPPMQASPLHHPTMTGLPPVGVNSPYITNPNMQGFDPNLYNPNIPSVSDNTGLWILLIVILVVIIGGITFGLLTLF